MNPAHYPPLDDSLFASRTDWIMHDGTGCPVEPTRYVRVMYSNGFIASKVRVAHAWTNWTGGRSWWENPGDGRLFILMFIPVT